MGAIGGGCRRVSVFFLLLLFFHLGGIKSCDMAKTGLDMWEKRAILQNVLFTSHTWVTERRSDTS